MTTATFSADWTAPLRENGAEFLRFLKERPIRCLEIGVFEGRGGCWLLDNILVHPESSYVGIDAWEAVPLGDSKVAEERARQHLSVYGKRVTILKGRTRHLLTNPERHVEEFDLIYIDGDHSAQGCLLDTTLTWDLLSHGGIMVWDDYGNTDYPGVRKAVNAFLSCATDHEVLWTNWQKGVCRK